MSQVSSRSARWLAGTLAVGLGATSALVLAVAAPAGATDAPRAQAVGRFLDGQLGPQTLESVVDLQDARASNPGSVSDQNPLDAKAGGQGDVPLSGKLQQPGKGNAVHFGAANQVAKAKSNGFAYGASGAVANSGGASIGGKNNAYPADATFNLSGNSLPSPGSLPLPGAGSAAALGGVSASVGAVAALASTPAGFGHGRAHASSTRYQIGALTLTLGSPALGGVLTQLGNALQAPSLPLPANLPTSFPKSCSFTSQALSTMSLDGGAVTIDPSNGSISVDLAAVLKQAGADLNNLPANTDALAYLLDFLTSKNGLAKGLQAALHGVLDPMQANFATCLSDITAAFPPPLDKYVKKALTSMQGGQKQVEDAINGVVDQLSSAGGSNPLAPIADGLAKAVDIGVNVQPNGAHGTFHSALKATPDQATPVVSGQTVVRAVEINLLPAAGSSPAATLALGNAAAGPSTPGTSTSAPPVAHHPDAPPGKQIPTGVPAGAGTTGGGSHLPLDLLGIATVLAVLGAISYRFRPGRGL
jgi:hypothetical protein